MADRDFHDPKTQGIRHVYMSLMLLGQGTNKAPILGEGDAKATFFTQPVHTGASGSGTFTLTTKDPYVAVVSFDILYVQGTAAASSTCFWGVPVQNSNNTWTFTASLFPSGSAGDLASTDQLACQFVFRNSSVVP